MTLQQLICLFRAQTHDEAEPYLWSDNLLKIYVNEALDEACRRGELLRDSASPFCVIEFVAGTQTVDVDPRIVRIIQAKVDGRFAMVVDLAEMDAYYRDWQADSSQSLRTTHLVSGLTTGKLNLWPIPRNAGQIRLTVQRLPRCALEMPTDEPEIRRELHPALVDWMIYRAYSREDDETFNDAKAQAALTRFVAEFGGKASGRNEAWMRYGNTMNPPPIA